MDEKWIQKAIPKSHKGAFRKELGVPEGKKIPEKKLKKAEHSNNPKTRKRAILAETLKGMHPKKKKQMSHVSEKRIATYAKKKK
jgi:hypothetical protein